MVKQQLFPGLLVIIAAVISSEVAKASDFCPQQDRSVSVENKAIPSENLVNDRVPRRTEYSESSSIDTSAKYLQAQETKNNAPDADSDFCPQQDRSVPVENEAIPSGNLVNDRVPRRTEYLVPSSLDSYLARTKYSYFNSAKYLQAQETKSNALDADSPPLPLPEDLIIDRSGGKFPLGIVRPIPILEIDLNSDAG